MTTTGPLTGALGAAAKSIQVTDQSPITYELWRRLGWHDQSTVDLHSPRLRWGVPQLELSRGLRPHWGPPACPRGGLSLPRPSVRLKAPQKHICRDFSGYSPESTTLMPLVSLVLSHPRLVTLAALGLPRRAVPVPAVHRSAVHGVVLHHLFLAPLGAVCSARQGGRGGEGNVNPVFGSLII